MNQFLAIAPFLLAVPTVAFGALGASATLTPSITATGFHYDAALDNFGSTTVGTFWYAWVPGEDFLLSSPTNITSPAGWSAIITHLPATDTNGFAIQWTASSPVSDIPAGSSLTGFGFDSIDSPVQLQGNSAFYPATPVGTAFVYSGAPFSDAGSQFVATVAAPVPEPLSAAALFGAPVLLLLRRRR